MHGSEDDKAGLLLISPPHWNNVVFPSPNIRTSIIDWHMQRPFGKQPTKNKYAFRYLASEYDDPIASQNVNTSSLTDDPNIFAPLPTFHDTAQNWRPVNMMSDLWEAAPGSGTFRCTKCQHIVRMEDNHAGACRSRTTTSEPSSPSPSRAGPQASPSKSAAHGGELFGNLAEAYRRIASGEATKAVKSRPVSAAPSWHFVPETSTWYRLCKNQKTPTVSRGYRDFRLPSQHHLDMHRVQTHHQLRILRGRRVPDASDLNLGWNRLSLGDEIKQRISELNAQTLDNNGSTIEKIFDDLLDRTQFLSMIAGSPRFFLATRRSSKARKVTRSLLYS
ncbi:hypothetical protein F5Y16DRAFT_421507 [Xylariaceae sp. FL0255]|nr:hypothetical protein F5Y16DRAFT_421507 [Xylariaceae sp. FL0255]